MSDETNLVLRMLRELSTRLDEFRAETKEEFRKVNDRLAHLEHAVGGMAAHLFAFASRLADHDLRIAKLEEQPSK